MPVLAHGAFDRNNAADMKYSTLLNPSQNRSSGRESAPISRPSERTCVRCYHTLKCHSLLLCGLLAGCLVFGAGSLSGADSASWVSLFNGKDLTGWVPVNDAVFEVEDGNLRLVKGMGWLRSEKEYGDFVLEVEWRALEEQYDSGIFFGCGLEGKPWPKENWQLNLRYNMIGGLVKSSKVMVPAETPKMPVNQWVKLRLEVKGKKAALDVDGERAWETDVIERNHGYLGIQAENKSFDFRNFRIQDLGK